MKFAGNFGRSMKKAANEFSTGSQTICRSRFTALRPHLAMGLPFSVLSVRLADVPLIRL